MTRDYHKVTLAVRRTNGTRTGPSEIERTWWFDFGNARKLCTEREKHVPSVGINIQNTKGGEQREPGA